jgi:hypothetical protein
VPAAEDILVFSGSGSSIATAVPAETIGALQVSGGTTIALQAGAANTLTVSGGAAALSVASGSTLNVSGTTALIINLPTGSSGSISGTMDFAGAVHRLTATDASAITFQSGATFTANTGFTGNAFGTVNLNSVVFASGSSYVFKAGANPFGASVPSSVVVFQNGSLYSHQSTTTPAFASRTYANFELKVAGAITPSGASSVSINNLTVSQGIFNFNVTATPGHSIKGNISVASGAALNFSPTAAGAVNLNGSSAQTISGPGTIGMAVNSTLVVANSAGVNLNVNLTVVGGQLTVNSGANLKCAGSTIISGTGTFTLASGGTLGIGSADGITSSGATGNIQTTGRSFDSGANYTYNGTASQVTGNGLPASVNNLTIANTAGAVSLTADVTANGSTTIQSGGHLNVNAMTLGGPVTVQNGGTLSGNGTASGSVTVGGTIAPGASIGTLNSGSQTWESGGTYEVEMSALTGSAGAQWDYINITGDLTINATKSATFKIKPIYSGSGFVEQTYTWPIAVASGSVVSFSMSEFTVDTSLFTPTPPPGGTFSVVLDGRVVKLVYTTTSCVAATPSWVLDTETEHDFTLLKMTFISSSGLASVQALRLDGCSISIAKKYDNSTDPDTGGTTIGTVTVDAKTTVNDPSAPQKVVLWAKKTGAESTTAYVNAIAINTCGLGKSFDPVFTTLEIVSGNQVQQRFEGLLSPERYLHVINGSPGLKWLEVNMNGRRFRLNPLTNSQEVSADLGSAMLEGENNVVILTGGGAVGASAVVTIADTPGGNLVVLPELVKLSVTRTAAGLELSWPETLSGWQLEASAAASSGWTDVSITPATVDGQQAVTVPTGDGAQFYRLRSPAPAASSSPAPAVSAREAGTGIALQPAASSLQPGVKHVLGGVLW